MCILVRGEAMKKILFLVCLVICTSCGGVRTEQPHAGADQALLVGKVSCITLGWFSDNHNKAQLNVYRLNPDGSREYVNTITSDYSVLAVRPGVYGLSKTHFRLGAGLTYIDRGYETKGKPSHQRLFEPDFWQLTEVEQAAQMPRLATEFFGILKVQAGDVLYYGDLTLDTVTNRSMPMFTDARNRQAAEQAVGAAYPSKAGQLKDTYFIGPTFILGKIRTSRS